MSDSTPGGKPGEPQTSAEKFGPFKVITIVLIVVGLSDIAAGVLNLVRGLNEGSMDALLPEVIFYAATGTLIILSALLLYKRKALGMWILIASILGSTAYTLIVKHSLDLILILFGAAVIWQLVIFLRQGEIR
ncbi:hypothetical protein LARV_01038 [Longilinea arvoryzae]|uniref:Uncharacterized protein n=1 Tax=Longilinea arvoryzae TaxID=360412 RepID=A0A0S7BHP5_9CHLR|nr:hypothetical protein [Longilinea arvoryzae]GAP13285.1 hypothetical protein LARV_01038 [Longilinea arvoryzae]